MDTQGTVRSASLRPECPQDGKKGGGEPLEIDRRGRQVGLDLHVVQTTPHSASETVPGLRLAVEALRTPEVTLAHPTILLAPSRTPATGEQKRRVIMRNHHLLVHVRRRQTLAPERTTRAVARTGTEEAPPRGHFTTSFRAS